MITFRITFLLAFDLNKAEKPKKDKKSKGSKSKGSKKSSGKSSKKSSKSSKSFKKEKEVVPVAKPDYVIDIAQPLGSVHIEYELFPKKFKYKVDVVCWGPVAKIYTSNGTKSFKTVTSENLVWAPVYIEHYLNNLPTEELLQLKSRLITFNFSLAKKKLSKNAKSDKIKAFYMYEKDVPDTMNFVQVYDKNPNPIDETQILYEEMRKIVMECVRHPYKEEIVSSPNELLDKAHLFKIYKIIQKVYDKKEVNCFDAVPQEPPKNKKKASKKGKKQGGDNFKIQIRAEFFFTDPNLALFQTEMPKSAVPNTFLLVSVNNLLTINQKFELTPLVVKILKLSNFPDQVLRDQGYKTICINCNIPGIVEFHTANKEIKNTIRLNESRFLCTNNMSKLCILEFLTSNRTYLEIFASKTVKQDKAAGKKGKKKEKKVKKEVKKSLEEEFGKKVALACFDVSSLLNNVWDFKEKAQCHNPYVLYYESNLKDEEKKTNFLDRITVNELNLREYKPVNCSPLNEYVLTTLGTTLKLQVYFLAPHFSTLKVHRIPDTYKRILLFVFNEEVAQTLLNEILLHNESVIGAEVLTPNYMDPRYLTRKGAGDPQIYGRLLSGFVIDNGDGHIFFIEGISTGFILTIFQQVQMFNPSDSKVFYNSDFMFQERLYEELTLYGGFFVLTLKMPLQDIFAKEKIYIEGDVPVPCLRALKKLEAMMKCDRFQTILQCNLLPNILELLSLSLEFGLQPTWQISEEKTIERSSIGT